MEQKNRSPLELLISVVNRKDAEKISAFLEKRHVPIRYTLNASGTAKSEILDICGLDSLERSMIIGILSRENKERLFKSFERQLFMTHCGTGVAWTLSLNSAQSFLLHRMQQENITQPQKENGREGEAAMEHGQEYSMLVITCKPSFSEKVMDTARKAGARGGTILKARQEGSNGPTQYLGISLQEQREIIISLIPNEIRKNVMEAVSSSYGIHTEAASVIVSLPVDEVIGLVENSEDSEDS